MPSGIQQNWSLFIRKIRLRAGLTGPGILNAEACVSQFRDTAVTAAADFGLEWFSRIR